jgi:hypothetical protein
MRIYRSEALQIQLPPDISIARFRINVKAKKKAANTPKMIGFIRYYPTLLFKLPLYFPLKKYNLQYNFIKHRGSIHCREEIKYTKIE